MLAHKPEKVLESIHTTLAGTEGEKLAGSLSPFSHNIRRAPAKHFTRWSISRKSCRTVLSLSVKPHQRQIQLSEAEGPCSRRPRMHHHPDPSRTLQRRPIYSLHLPPRFNFQSTAFRGCEINEERIRGTLRVPALRLSRNISGQPYLSQSSNQLDLNTFGVYLQRGIFVGKQPA
ncbi:hypothetical protein BKA70DRAFT_1348375 [Coprinopsis sp. MPI-PUGE-AT-0042]|nr:hypothetical protein BKA70DRAFT_1348375 [Coprinopsis sp. MPI-PUGE-AT-0042]